MRDGRLLVGWGTATGVWGAFQAPASAKITYRADGTAHVASATSDIGPGTYTVMTMIAAEFLGLTPDKVQFELGDTKFPPPRDRTACRRRSRKPTARAGAQQLVARFRRP